MIRSYEIINNENLRNKIIDLMREASNEIIKKASEKMHTLQRIGRPKDISNMIKFLINPENNWITGQNFIVDGGLSSTK